MTAIRKGQLRDSAVLEALARQLAVSYEIDSSKFAGVLAAVSGNQDACLLVAELGERVCGYALAFKHPVFYANGPVAWVEEILVEESKRRQGIGKELISAIEIWAMAEGCAQVALASQRAKDFYGAIGYENTAAYFKKKLGH